MRVPARSTAITAARKYIWAIAIASLLSLFSLRQCANNSAIDARERHHNLTVQLASDREREDARLPSTTNPTSLTVHLVIASTSSDDVSWMSKIDIPHLKVIHYIADDDTALYHPPANKGRETLIYHTYFHDFYNHLPDIAILTYANDVALNLEPLLSHSLPYAISHLDPLAVQERGYANLRVSWQNDCPAHINTTHKWSTGLGLEEQSTREAFVGTFGSTSVPEVLAQPCGSHFAVSRDRIRSVPREQYARMMNWILTTDMDDSMVGRSWEHMFQWLFAKKGIDCPVEWKAYCLLYHICFEGKKEYEEYLSLGYLRADLIDRFNVGIARTMWNWVSGLGRWKERLTRKIDGINQRMKEMKQASLDRGTEGVKIGDLYLDD